MAESNSENLSSILRSSAEELDLAGFLAIIIDRRRVIAAITILITVLAIAYALLVPPTYSADFSVQVELPTPGEGAGSQGLLAANLSSFLGVSSQATTEIQIITSRLVLGKTVDDLALFANVTPKTIPVLGAIAAKLSTPGTLNRPWLGLSSYAWGGEEIKVSTFDVPPSLYNEKFTLMAGEGSTYQLEYHGDVVLTGRLGQRAVGRGEFSGVSMTVSELIARPGTEFTAVRFERLATIDELNKRLVVAEQVKESGVISATLTGPNPELLTTVVTKIASVYIAQNAERKAAEADSMIAFLNEQVPLAKSTLETAERKFTDYRRKQGIVNLSEESGLLLKQIVDAQTSLGELQQRRSSLLLRFTPNNPNVKATDAEMSQVSATLSRLNARVSALPTQEQEALGLTRDIQVNTQLYTNLLNNVEQLKVIRAGKIGTVRLIDKPEQPFVPIKPKKALVVVAGLVLGLVLGVIAALLDRSLRGGVDDPGTVERDLGLTVFATIPHSSQQMVIAKNLKSHSSTPSELILTLTNPHDLAVESLRSLRTTLHFATAGAPNKILMLTGPAPGVGKSFISVNIAAIWAASGKRVLLIDCDLRRGYLHEYFALDRGVGVSDVVLGAISLQQAIKAEVISNLDIVTTGALPPNPSELLLNPAFEAMLKDADKNYDLVIVDTPPVLAVTDAAIVGRMVGTSLMILKSGSHRINEIDVAVKRLKQAGVIIRGVMFNNVPISALRNALGLDTYSYYYDYSSDRKDSK